MTWEYQYDGSTDETTIYWDGKEQTVVNEKITKWKNGYPANDGVREAIRDVLQTTDHPTTILMQYDMMFGFEPRDETE